MQSLKPTQFARQAARQERAVVAGATASRRAVLASIVVGGFVLPASLAYGKDVQEAIKEREERRKRLREAAEVQKETGKAADAFQQPAYSLSEESRTTNFHARCESNACQEGNK